MSITINRDTDPVPVLVDTFHAIHLAGRLGLLTRPADEAWDVVVNALNEHADPGYIYAADSTASVPYGVTPHEAESYTQELIWDVPFSLPSTVNTDLSTTTAQEQVRPHDALAAAV